MTVKYGVYSSNVTLQKKGLRIVKKRQFLEVSNLSTSKNLLNSLRIIYF